MILGVVTITGLLIRKLNQTQAAPIPALAEVVSPDTLAYSVTPDWIITTTQDGTITVYSKQDLTPIASFDIPAP